LIRFNCPSCNKLYSFVSLPIPDSGAEFLCARCNSRCHLSLRHGEIQVELIAVPEADEESMSQQVYDSYRPFEEESYAADELERRLRGLITELPVGIEYSIGVIEGPDRGMIMPVQQATILVGKTGCDLNLSDTSVSREHCRIEIYGREMIVVRDLDSNWGTFKNGSQVTLATLKPGDKLQVGKTTLALIQSRSGLD